MNSPFLKAFVTGLRAMDVVGKVGHKRILDATPEQLSTLAHFVLAVKKLKETTETNPDYWDCECKVNYIHKKTERLACHRCGATQDEQPDSRVSEI
jgi:hypothetical protein